MVTTTQQFVRATTLTELKKTNCMNVVTAGHTLALFNYDGTVFAVDNRCPHMGFPLHQGTVQDGILTCHWHHARFDLASGGTFDQWADDVRSFPVEIRDDEIWVDIAPLRDPLTHQQKRLQDGLERNISLVMAKAVITLLEGGVNAVDPFRIGLDFGINYRESGWGQGLTIHACMMNLLDYLDRDDYPHALYHGLSAVASDSEGHPPRFVVSPLPGPTPDIATLKRWFRQFIEVRDAESAERCVVSAVRAGADDKAMADMLFAATTDHRYINGGHVLDFTNKALEALDVAGWEHAELTLTSLIPSIASATRMEEDSSWRTPIDLIPLLHHTFDKLSDAVESGRGKRGTWDGRAQLADAILSLEPQDILTTMLDAVRAGCSEVELASTVSYAAALRIARFHISNEFGDWDTALHTFTFANAVEQGLRRVASPDLFRGVFDAAMSVYLDRFLNIPATPLPKSNGKVVDADTILADLPQLLDKQQRVNQAGNGVGQYLFAGGDARRLMAVMGKLLLREDRDFHTIQTIEAAFRQYRLLEGQPEADYVLVAAARYLAAHAPTMRAQKQTYHIAHRLAHGELLFQED